MSAPVSATVKVMAVVCMALLCLLVVRSQARYLYHHRHHDSDPLPSLRAAAASEQVGPPLGQSEFGELITRPVSPFLMDYIVRSFKTLIANQNAGN